MSVDISYFGLTSETLPTGWREDRLDSIAFFNPEQIGNDLSSTFIEYLDISNVEKGTLGRPEHLALENAPSRAKRIVAVQDTIISTVRPGNRAYAFLNEVLPNLIVSTGFAVLRAKDSDPRFLYYLATSDPIINYLASIAEEKTAYPSVNPADLAECLVPIPPLPEQRAIARILGALDDKIELNRRTNETLEAMARSIFDHFFPYSPEDDLPEGWRVTAFSEIVEIMGGGTPKTSISNYWNGDIPWFSVVDAPSDSDIFVLDTDKHISEAGIENSSTKVLPIGTTIVTARGTVGKLAFVGAPMAMNQSCYGLRGKNDKTGYFTYFMTRQIVGQLQQHAHGSVFNTITRNTLAGIDIVNPSDDVLRDFTLKVKLIMIIIRKNLEQSRTLAALRDALLPKLLTGEIRVKDVN